MLPFCREYDTSQNCMYRPAIEYGHPEVEIIWYGTIDRMSNLPSVEQVRKIRSHRVCRTHTAES